MRRNGKSMHGVIRGFWYAQTHHYLRQRFSVRTQHRRPLHPSRIREHSRRSTRQVSFALANRNAICVWEEVNACRWGSTFLIGSRSNCILRLHIAKPIGTLALCKPLLTKLRGYDGALGAM